MNEFLLIFQNKILAAALISWLISQIIKGISSIFTEGKFSLERLLGDGGMPSGHSATVVTLATLIGYTCGFNSAIFALALVFAIVVMRDACGVRRETGKQTESIKELADAINSLLHEKKPEVKTEKLKELVGHTPIQVFFGALLGLTVSIIFIIFAF